MASTNEILVYLRKALKRNKVTYADIGKKLRLSESSIKRLFSKGDMPLSRLQQICEILGLDIADLAMEAIEARRNITELTEAQEVELTSDAKFLLFAYLITADWTYTEVVEKYKFTPAEATMMLVKLDKMKLIELLPENRIRLRIARNFSWRENGPISQYFEKQVQAEFFKNDFNQKESLKLAVNGYVSQNSLTTLHEKMEALHRDFSEFSQKDAKLKKDNLLPVTMVNAIRPWVFSAFQHYSREND